MINVKALLHPSVPDREGLDEFINALADRVPEIERSIARLKRTPRDEMPHSGYRELIAELFRALHTIKGDAAMCKVDLGVMIAHPIESLLSRLREGEIGFSDLLAEVILLALDRLELAVEALASSRPLDHLKLIELVGGLDGMAKVDVGEIDLRAIGVIEAVTGFRPAQAQRTIKAAPVPRSREAAGDDLQFFRSLAMQLETRSPFYKGRTNRILRLALDTNAAAGKPVDPLQLEVAVYLHDVGMMFLPEPIWLKSGRLDENDKKAMHTHPAYAAGLLARMSVWDAAATMVAQHHEMPDGAGYPAGLRGDAIVPGAKILAIVDAFEAVMQKHSDRGHSRSLLRAIAEVNACDNQFAPEWTGHFNAVVRKMVEA